MDHCAAKGFGIVSQLFSDTASDTRSPAPAPGWQHIFNCYHHQHHQQQQGRAVQQRAEEVLCPEPRRAVRVPCLVEDNLTLTRLFSSASSSSSLGVVDCCGGFEILGVILSQKEQQQDGADSDTVSYFRGTPPARTGNPLIRDSEFVHQHTTLPATTTTSIPPFAGTSHGRHHHHSRHHGAGGGLASCGSSSSSSFRGKQPKVRIEGFASGSSASKPPPFRVATTALA